MVQYIIIIIIIIIGRAMAQALSRRPLTAEARVRSRVSPCGICGGQSGTLHHRVALRGLLPQKRTPYFVSEYGLS